jgi:hypothetical protein
MSSAGGSRLALGAAALACAGLSALPPLEHSRPRLELSGATGAVDVSTSRPGTAIVSAHGLRPGDTATGTVSVRNRGAATARLRLSSSAARDTVGPGGGRLSERLIMSVAEVSERPVRVRSGALGSLAGCHDLGPLRPGTSRAFRFTVRFERGTDRRDNAYAGSSASVDERWVAAAGGRCRAVAGERHVGGVRRDGRTGAAPGTATRSGEHAALPFTGLELALLAGIGGALLAAGAALRRRERSRP